MQKDFDNWNGIKKKTDLGEDRLFFKEGEVWWVRLGLNVGFEMNGKGLEYTRPVAIIKKYNKYSFLALPLSTSTKISPYRISVGIVDGKEAVANLSQLRNIDSKRLVKKIGHIEHEVFDNLKKKTSQINFG